MLTLTFYVRVAFLVQKGIKQWLHEHNIPNLRLDLIIYVKNQSINVQTVTTVNNTKNYSLEV